jgi:hypothetical protein
MSDTGQAPDANKLVKVYIKMRTKRSELKAAYELEDNEVKRQMEIVEGVLLDICKTAGATSLNTESGTVIKGTTTRYWPSDWDSMHQFIRDNDALDLLERRIAQKAMGEFIANNPDKFPKGMNVDSKFSITVRRKS